MRVALAGLGLPSAENTSMCYHEMTKTTRMADRTGEDGLQLSIPEGNGDREQAPWQRLHLLQVPPASVRRETAVTTVTLDVILIVIGVF